MFNYQNLESGQFEKLCRDIMQVITGKQLHVFARGRDGGVDLTDDSDKHNIVVQVKHYEKSGFAALRSNLEKEIEKVKKLKPKKYYVCAAQSLTDANVNTIYQMFSDYMESTNNILTLDDIDSFLHDQKNIQITRKHTNLWLESGTTLQLLLECFPNEYMNDAKSAFSIDMKKSNYKVYTLYASNNRELSTTNDKNHIVLSEIYLLDEEEQFCVELRDEYTQRKYKNQSKAIDMFLHDVLSSDQAVNGYFELYLRNYMTGKKFSSESNDKARMDSFADITMEIINRIISDTVGIFSLDRDTYFHAFIEQDYVEIYQFAFGIPTLELKKYCNDKNIDFSLLCLSRAGYYVADLGYRITMDYIVPEFYSALSYENHSVMNNKRIRNLLCYSIGP